MLRGGQEITGSMSPKGKNVMSHNVLGSFAGDSIM